MAALGTENFVLKDYAMPYGQALDNLSNSYEKFAALNQQKAHDTALQKMKAEQAQQKGQVANMKQTNNLPTYTPSGNIDLDNYGIKETQKRKEEMMRPEIVNDPILFQKKNSEFRNFLQQLNQYKENYNGALEQLKVIGKEAPNIPQIDAKDFVNHWFQEDFFENDEKGGIRLKQNPTMRNYGNMLMSPDILKYMPVSPDPLIKHAQSGASIISDADMVNNKGYVKGQKYAATVTPYTDIKLDKKGMPIVDVKHEVVPGVKNADGTPFKVASKEVMESIINGSPALRVAFSANWGKKKDELEKSLKRPLQPAEEEMQMKKYGYDFMKMYSPHGVKTEEKVAIPKDRVVNNYYGSGGRRGGGSGGLLINDVAASVPIGRNPASKLPTEALKAVMNDIGIRYKNIAPYISQDDIEIEKMPDGQVKLYMKDILNKDKTKQGEFVERGYLTETGINLGAKGNTGKVSQVILNKQQSKAKQAKPTSKLKKIKGF